jgi:effector-binding domain-containing protein
MWRNIGLSGLAILAILIGFGFMLPAKTKVEQTVTVNAPQQVVFGSLDNLREFNAWSPWLKRAPDMVFAYAGPDSGEGASVTWTSKVLGRGSMTIMSETSPSRIDLTTEYPDRWNSKGWFDVAPMGSATKVTWGYESQPYGMALWLRYYGAFVTTPQLRREYAAGLADFKSYIESRASMPTPLPAGGNGPQAAASPALAEPMVAVSGEPVSLKAEPVVLVAGDAAGAGIETAVNAAYAKIDAFIKTEKLSAAGAPIAITHSYDAASDHWVFDAGVRLAAKPGKAIEATDGISFGETYAGKAVKFAYHGRPDETGPTYAAIRAWLAAKKLQQNGEPWEEYLSDDSVPKEDWNIVIYYPVK